MKIGKYTAALALCAVLFFSVYIPVSAGTYTVTQAVSCDFAETPVAIKNKLGFTMSVTPYVCNTPVTNVTRITGYYRPTAILLNIGFIDIDVYYSKDGSAYTYGTRIENIDVGRQYSYSITISGSPATVYSITFVPNLMYVPGISYSLTSPRCTCLLTDNTPPTVSLHEQDEYSNTGVTIYADAADSESGVAVMKWAMGTQSASYFANEGTEFSSSFTISTTGIVTVYVKDNAGNETVALYTITK
ncbi:MAG: hypothetical protein PHD46_05600, partial [Eubacteriales bacterium]|nr:hypothetical protein [Eubacteriales bacterium]